jgi:hypothetical protein
MGERRLFTSGVNPWVEVGRASAPIMLHAVLDDAQAELGNEVFFKPDLVRAVRLP